MTLGLKFKQQTPPDVLSRYFRKAWCMSGISIHLLNYASTVHKAVQYKSKLPTHWNLISCNMSAPPLLLSPSSILPPTVSHWAFISARKNCARI